VFGTFTSSDTAQATAKTADGFYGFEPGTAQAGNVAPIAGICYAMMIEDTSIFSTPDTTSALVTTMHKNDYAMITAHSPGWFTLDLNVASPSTDKLGYLEESKLGGFNGPCS